MVKKSKGARARPMIYAASLITAILYASSSFFLSRVAPAGELFPWWKYASIYSGFALIMNVQWFLLIKEGKFSWRFFILTVAVMCLAMPVIEGDFWLSIGWGRAILNGLNPYYLDPALIDNTNLPLVFEEKMTYGPLWAMTAAAATTIGFWAHKAVLGLFYIGTVWVIKKISGNRAAILFGFSPLCMLQALGDGHNDIAMIFFMALWIWAMKNDRPIKGALFLALATSMKYVTAPLFVVHSALLLRAKRFKEFFLSGLMFIGPLGVMFMPFYKSPDFFNETASMRASKFFTPECAVSYLTHHDASYVNVIIIALVGFQFLRLLKNPEFDELVYTTLCVMAGVMMAGVGHVWPWFILWPLAVAAMIPARNVSKWVFAFSIVMTLIFSTSIPGVLMDYHWRTRKVGVLIYVLVTVLFFVFKGTRLQVNPRPTESLE